MKKDFLHICYPVDVKVRRFKIIDSLIYFITWVARPEYPSRTEKDVASRYRGEINAELFNFAEYNFAGLDISDPGDDIDLLVELFSEAKKRYQIGELCEIGFRDTEFANVFCERLGISKPVSEISPTLIGAYEQAQRNFVKAETALVALSVVRSAVQLRQKNLESENELGEKLGEKRKKFMQHILLFGNLLGGDYGVEATKMVTNEMLFNPDSDIEFSIIQYLQEGCIHPGRYASKDDEDFRNDILKHYNELTTKHKD